jgi:hypothetical protein
MATISEDEFDKLVHYTLRIELQDGDSLIYPIDINTKKYLMSIMREVSTDVEDKDYRKFIFFTTTLDRAVFVNTAAVSRIIFCFDNGPLTNAKQFHDNFEYLKTVEEETTQDEDDADDELYLPQAMIKLFHPKDDNVLFFSSLDEGDLCTLDLEVQESSLGLRQFINLIDDDGEENFILLSNIAYMEVESSLLDFDESEMKDDDD